MNNGSPIEFKTFLESVPPLEARAVLLELHQEYQRTSRIVPPPIYLYCTDADCRGPRFYDYRGGEIFVVSQGKAHNEFLRYTCRNCRAVTKIFAVGFFRQEAEEVQALVKLGEMPRFGEPRPNVVADVLDDEIEYFERGYRAETDGLGIGAFAYYRRFVESHKDKIIAEIRKVAVAQTLPAEIIATLDRAATKREFKSAVEEIKDAIPDSLKIGGMNPLTLLHNALSSGLHSDDDVECLEIAQDIRTVLTALASRTGELLKAESGFKAAVTRLNQRNAGQKPTPPK